MSKISHPLTRLLLAAVVVLAPLPAQAAGRHPAPTSAAAQANILALQAVQFHDQKDFLTAAKLFLRAYSLDPAPDYAYSAGRAEEDGGALLDAERHYQTLLETTDPGNRFYAKAKARLAVVRMRIAVGKAAAAAKEAAEHPPAPPIPLPPESMAEAETATASLAVVPPPVVLAPAATPTVAEPPGIVLSVAPPEPGHVAAGRSSLALGAVAELAAIVLLATAYSDQNALDAKRTLNGNFDPRTAQLVDVQKEQRSINARVVAGWTTGGVGTVAFAAGIWLLATSPQRVAVLPAPDLGGARLALRF